ncbi:unnamed protein product, partial [Closterium sp. NIES-54]
TELLLLILATSTVRSRHFTQTCRHGPPRISALARILPYVPSRPRASPLRGACHHDVSGVRGDGRGYQEIRSQNLFAS